MDAGQGYLVLVYGVVVFFAWKGFRKVSIIFYIILGIVSSSNIEGLNDKYFPCKFLNGCLIGRVLRVGANVLRQPRWFFGGAYWWRGFSCFALSVVYIVERLNLFKIN